MDKETKIKFSAADSGVSSFMKKLQNDTKSLYSEFLKEAQKQTNSQKEQLKIVEQQIKALERQNILEKEQNRILLERKRSAGFLSGGDFTTQVQQLRRDTAVDSAQSSILKDMLATMKESKKEGVEPVTGRQIFGNVLAANLVSDFIKNIGSALKGTATAQSGLDLIVPAGRTLGAFGEFGGQAYLRHLMLNQDFARASNAYGSLTGGNLNLPSMTYMGYNGIEAMQRAAGIARSRGGRLGAGDVSTFLGLSRGFGIEEGAMNQAFEGERMGGSSAATRMQRTLGIAIAEGLDRAKFTDAIKNQNQLLAQFAQTSTNVSDERMNRVLFEFNRMGGMFKIGDPRSMGLLSNLQDSLANPKGGFAQALSYSVLRKLPGNENADIFDLITQREQGLQTPGYLKGLIGAVKNMGVSSSFQKLMFKNMTNGMANVPINTIWENWENIDSMTPEQINKMLSQKTIAGQADKFTNPLLKMEAEVSDTFRESMIKGIGVIATQFEGQLKIAVSEVAKHFRNEFMSSGNPNLDSKLDKYYDKNTSVLGSETLGTVDRFMVSKTLDYFQRFDKWLNWGPKPNQSKGK